IFGFLGPNGAGKTTTMRMLLGLVRPTSGTARLLGMSIDTDLPTILARTGALIENPTFYPYLSGTDNLRAFARLGGIEETGIAAILDLVDLTRAASRRFSTYSLGMKQRLAVGAALLHRPDLLILDEPANGLDPAGIVEMRDLMKRLKGEGHTVLISSHVLHEIEHICDRIAIMNRGKVVVQGRVGDLLGRGDALEVRVESLEEATRILSGASWVRGIVREADRLLVSAPLDSAATITKLLADHGVYISGLKPQEQSLEQYFLDVTGETR
ncbi:MAG TPA: ABC transporter ATP-binding protein, partial [Chloroflexota bacterium]|nr:ABC transporter ATP-binding protein [Chloroflexota bacterium]